MNQYLLTQDESRCCGCRACQQICPQNAISMAPNKEGFLYPVLDAQKCIQCGLCSGVCPVEHPPRGTPPLSAYAVQHRDDAVLLQSSSGGAFRLLADEILESSGCVVGCKWGEGFRPVLDIAETKQDLSAMQGSKYLSSDTGHVFSQVQERLDAGQQVLFTGAPCQCAGLKTYLKKDYDNLLTADFLCHGMPSQQIFDAYRKDLESRAGSPVYDIRFRDKSARGWGMAFSYKYRRRGKEKKVTNIGWTDPYQYGFIQGYFHRYSCYACPFRGSSRFTDFTFCDYWGVENFHPEIPSAKGVSAVTVNTGKAARLWQTVLPRIHGTPTQPQAVAAENPTLLKPVTERIPDLRGSIYEEISQDGWRSAARRHLRVRHCFLKKLWYHVPREQAAKLKKCLRRSR